MSGYLTPADVTVSDNYAGHKRRGSAEPGTDYATAYGTDLRAPGNGTIILVDHDPSGPEGRRISFLMDNGEVIDWIHLSKIMMREGQKIGRGTYGIALSGASGFGSNRHYGPHVHVTRRARRGLAYRNSIDFEAAVGGGGGATPPAGGGKWDEATAQRQAWLNSRGWNLKVDGIQGAATTQAIREYQAQLNQILGTSLAVDGIWGGATQAAHQRFYDQVMSGGGRPSNKSAGELTYADIQSALVRHGYSIAVDGIWGRRSSDALADFQRRHGLKVDRIVGPATWDLLNR